VSFETVSHVLKDISSLKAAGADNGQQPFEEAITSVAVGAITEFAPDDIGTNALLGAVVGGFNALMSEKKPEALEGSQQIFARS